MEDISVRSLFVPHVPVEDGGIIIQADLSQIEVVALAYLCNDPDMKHDIQEGIDFHLKMLSAVEGKSYDDLLNLYVSEDSQTIAARKKIKSVRFQAQYGATARSIVESTGLPYGEVIRILKADEEAYPNVSRWHNDLLDELDARASPRKDGIHSHIRSPTGRRYHFFRDPKDRGWYLPKLKNYPVQGFAGDLLRIWLISLGEQNWKVHTRMINTVHDSVLWTSIEEEKADTLHKIEYASNNVPTLLKKWFGLDWDLPFRYDVEIGTNWGLTND